MRNAIRVITATVIISLAGSLVPAAAHPVSADPGIVFGGFTKTERRLAIEAISLFHQAGLPLPRLEFHRHHSKAPCHGFDGLHTGRGPSSTIHICVTGADAYVQRIIIHELGHAWSSHYLTAAHRAQFQKVRGWKVWLDYGRADWEGNGAEQASEIIVWALSDHAVPVVKIDHHTCADLQAGYVALTGLQPLHGYTNLCDERTVNQLS